MLAGCFNEAIAPLSFRNPIIFSAAYACSVPMNCQRIILARDLIELLSDTDAPMGDNIRKAVGLVGV